MIQLDLSGGKAEQCVFCKIIKGELTALVVFEDEMSIAFLDNKPVFTGHTLLVPKVHHQLVAQLPRALVSPLFENLQLLSEGVKAGMKAEGTLLAINNGVSQHVPHLHIHVIPRRKGDGLKGFFWPRTEYKDEKTALAVQRAIRSAVEQIGEGRG
jgi:histidine triad (HIT) family protein